MKENKGKLGEKFSVEILQLERREKGKEWEKSTPGRVREEGKREKKRVTVKINEGWERNKIKQGRNLGYLWR